MLNKVAVRAMMLERSRSAIFQNPDLKLYYFPIYNISPRPSYPAIMFNY